MMFWHKENQFRFCCRCIWSGSISIENCKSIRKEETYLEGIIAGIKSNISWLWNDSPLLNSSRQLCFWVSPGSLFLSIIMGTVRSLENKIDELPSVAGSRAAFRDALFMCLMATWLQDKCRVVVAQAWELEAFCLERCPHAQSASPEQGLIKYAASSFTVCRWTRIAGRTKRWKRQGDGGVDTVYINRWCNPRPSPRLCASGRTIHHADHAVDILSFGVLFLR